VFVVMTRLRCRVQRTLRRGWRRGADGENGFVLVWMALMLTTLIAIAGFAVDFWGWNREGAREQKAADAAALAAAVYMPNNFSTAVSTAKAIAADNGYTDGQNGVTVSVTVGDLPTQVNVRITRNVKNTFGAIVGAGSTTVSKHAVGEYEAPANMGSPINQFGNDPTQATITHGSTNYPDMWANVFGPSSNKDKGDAILAKLCPASTDNCAVSNTDYDPNGYFYAVSVPDGSSGTLNFQAFDPEFANVGDNCASTAEGANGAPNRNLAGLAALPANFNPQFPIANPSVVYNTAANSPYCTGDQYYSDGSNPLVPPWTTFIIRGPDDTPSDPTNNPILCKLDFPGYMGDLAAAVSAQTKLDPAAPDLFVKYFRQWYSLCNLNITDGGTYFIQVETATKSDGTATPNGGGANRFALRVGFNNSFVTGITRMYGQGRMGVYANAPGANTTFYLVRLLPGASGRNLVLSFFDTGDAASPGTITVLPPPDSNVGASFSGCTYTPPPGNSTGPPWGTFTATQSGCSVSNVSSSNGFNGQWVQYKVPVPDTYTCNYNDPNGCWVRVNFNFPSQTSVSDTTTWMATIEGDPVRLVA
jgi:Flp pilus assembly protein TadG